MSRKIVLAVLAAALLSATAALAAPVPPASAPTPPAPSGCPHSPLFELATPAPAASPASQTPPEWLEGPAAESSTVRFRGYCACECSTIKDCNVNSDCSNNRCLKAISCC